MLCCVMGLIVVLCFSYVVGVVSRAVGVIWSLGLDVIVITVI